MTTDTTNHSEPISSDHYSHDQQVMDALSYLESFYPADYVAVVQALPELESVQWAGSWFDVEAMNVDPEFSSWAADAIEETGRVFWEEGEPWRVVDTVRDGGHSERFLDSFDRRTVATLEIPATNDPEDHALLIVTEPDSEGFTGGGSCLALNPDRAREIATALLQWADGPQGEEEAPQGQEEGHRSDYAQELGSEVGRLLTDWHRSFEEHGFTLHEYDNGTSVHRALSESLGAIRRTLDYLSSAQGPTFSWFLVTESMQPLFQGEAIGEPVAHHRIHT